MSTTFNRLLVAAGLDPADIRLLRHADPKSAPGRTPFHLWQGDRAKFERYQSTQRIDGRTRSKLDSSYWASFVGTPDGETLFVGLYRVRYLGLLSEARSAPHHDGIDEAGSLDEYELVLDERLRDQIGQLYVDWGRSKRAWIQRADLQDKAVYKGSRGATRFASTVERFLHEIEANGDLPKMANANSGWFAVAPRKWKDLALRAAQEGRTGPDLIVYRTKTDDPRDHYVIPYSVTRELLTEETAPPRAGKPPRWELTLRSGQLRVTHGTGSVDVSAYRGLALPGEVIDDAARSGLHIWPDDVPSGATYREGATKAVLVNAYERDPRCRAACLAHYGHSCVVCGMSFGSQYGAEFAGMIHVHHLTLISARGGSHEVDPVADLRPVCPNCHAAIHRRSPPYTPDEVRARLHAARQDTHG
ncbi:MAG: HNH endonuclease [Planctomycetes bacterium]|nr:HNH endonuclease [Planctomycetota bacterium]